MRVPDTSHPGPKLLGLILLSCFNRCGDGATGVSICISPVSKDTGNLFMGLVAICVSSLGKHMFESLAPFAQIKIRICFHIDGFFSTAGTEPGASHMPSRHSTTLRSIPSPLFPFPFLKHLR